MSKVILTESDFTHSDFNNQYSLTDAQKKSIQSKIKTATEVVINFEAKRNGYTQYATSQFSDDFWKSIDFTGKKLTINTKGFDNFGLQYGAALSHPEAKLMVDDFTINMENAFGDTFFNIDYFVSMPNAKTFKVKCSDFKLPFDGIYGKFDKLQNIIVEQLPPHKTSEKVLHYTHVSAKNINHGINVDLSKASNFYQTKEYKYPLGTIYNESFSLDFTQLPKAKLTFNPNSIIQLDHSIFRDPMCLGLNRDQYIDYLNWLEKNIPAKTNIASLFPLLKNNNEMVVSWEELEKTKEKYLKLYQEQNLPKYFAFVKQKEEAAAAAKEAELKAFKAELKKFNPAQQIYLKALYEIDSDEFLTSQYVPHTVKNILSSVPEDFNNIKTLDDVKNLINVFYEKKHKDIVNSWKDDKYEDGSMGLELSNADAAQKELLATITKLSKSKGSR